MACKHCRDRKVRCDGEQPSCAKCVRAGEECVYLATQRPSRADLTQTVQALQQRLRMRTFLATPFARAVLAPITLEIVVMTSEPHAALADIPGGQMHLDPPEQSGRQNVGGAVEIVDELNFANDFRAQATRLHDHVEPHHIGTPTLSSSGSETAHCSSLPTLREHAASNTPQSKPPSNDDGATANRAIATQIAQFSSAVFHSQAEIAGMSLAVAEYIAWMRKVPGRNAPPNTTLVYDTILEAVEAAFRDMTAALGNLGPAGSDVCESLAGVEDEFQRRSADVAEFFQTRYNACMLLSEQARDIPHAVAGSEGLRVTAGSLPRPEEAAAAGIRS
ncbi:unnamed protein product [Parascedosporium putredinis]|uniref:Zn(2)-C6 fungal-type domain-containing protein n=1 Tax=Parascedosporium putredinis TaxID=1442378 RepID=A0A9P1H112_9PEZI|nr:unnamed protein product [Parascedosporium putredinis]CAI7993315.1 unnamed protein product [Parascedosporium putredinis]